MISLKECRKSWNCPSDRELRLRAKLNTGWSIHTENLFRKIESIPPAELAVIEKVIQRSRNLEQVEVDRIGRLVCRLENMTRNILGDGEKTCSMCGIGFGWFRSSYVYCYDCAKAVCEKCRVDTVAASLEVCMLCKICSENREVWKKSGGWFYGKLPTVNETCQKETIAQISGSPNLVRAYDTWAHRAPDIVRLQSFEPPEENHNDNSFYKDWTMGSTPDLTSIEDNNTSYVELKSFSRSFHNEKQSDSCYLSVEGPKMSASCPSLADLKGESPKLIRKASIRRKKTSTAQKFLKKIGNKFDHKNATTAS